MSRGKTRRKKERLRMGRPYRHREYGPRQAEEIAEIDGLLRGRPELVAAVAYDLVTAVAGEQSMTAEQCLRAFIVKDMNGYNYSDLARRLADSRSYEAFCGTDALHAGPRTSATLEAYLEQITAETIEKVHAALIQRST